MATFQGPHRVGGVVLLVDDEELVRGVARAVLARMGLTVLEAPDGAAALRLAEAHAGAIDLLVADVVMPGLGGRAIAERLRASRPGLRVLYLSGHPACILDPGALLGADAFLAKPFRIDALERDVRRVLDA